MEGSWLGSHASRIPYGDTLTTSTYRGVSGGSADHRPSPTARPSLQPLAVPSAIQGPGLGMPKRQCGRLELGDQTGRHSRRPYLWLSVRKLLENAWQHVKFYLSVYREQTEGWPPTTKNPPVPFRPILTFWFSGRVYKWWPG